MKNGYRIQIKLYDKNGKMILRTDSGKRAVISSRLRSHIFQNGYLKVTYENGTAYNDTEGRADKETLFWALTTFTEVDLVNTFRRKN